MRSDMVVLLPPDLDQYFRFQQRCEDLPVNQFIPEIATAVLGGLAMTQEDADEGMQTSYQISFRGERSNPRVGWMAYRLTRRSIDVTPIVTGAKNECCQEHYVGEKDRPRPQHISLETDRAARASAHLPKWDQEPPIVPGTS